MTDDAPAPGPWTIRAQRAQDEAAVRALDDNAFGYTESDAAWALSLSVYERERTLIAVDDDDRPVGSAGAYSFTASVPGDVPDVGVAGVSWVAVSPDRRRRGVLGSLMRRQLTDLHAAGREPVAALWCSEATIYGRYGYASAAPCLQVTLPRRPDLVRADLAATDLTPELVDTAGSVAEVEAVYATVRGARPGMPARNPAWQAALAADPPGERSGASALRTVILRGAGGRPRATARYRTRRLPEGQHGREVEVGEVYADGPRSHAAVWRYLTDLDLTTKVTARVRPVDDPVLDQLTDVRAVQVRHFDGVWVRLVDLPRALAARGYADTVDVVLEVADAVLPQNAGRWRLRTRADGADLTRTDAEPDLSLDTATLAGSWFGLPGALVRAGHAGRVTEHRPGVLSPLSRAFDSDTAPWWPLEF